jgi:hypothetical protein
LNRLSYRLETGEMDHTVDFMTAEHGVNCCLLRNVYLYEINVLFRYLPDPVQRADLAV